MRVCLKICKLVDHALKYKGDMKGFKMSQTRTNHSCDSKENQTEENDIMHSTEREAGSYRFPRKAFLKEWRKKPVHSQKGKNQTQLVPVELGLLPEP